MDDLSIYDPGLRLGRIGIPTPTQSEKDAPQSDRARRVELLNAEMNYFDDNNQFPYLGDNGGFSFGANYDGGTSFGVGGALDGYSSAYLPNRSTFMDTTYSAGLYSSSVPNTFSLDPWVCVYFAHFPFHLC